MTLTQLYRHFDKDDKLLYVGISRFAIFRLREHEKHSHWFARVAYIRVENFNTRSEALAAERIAIQSEHPAHNILYNRDFLTENRCAEVHEVISDEARRDGAITFEQWYRAKSIPRLIDFLEWLESQHSGERSSSKGANADGACS